MRLAGIEFDGVATGGGGFVPADTLTYDPTQGRGTSAWQRSVQMNMQLNAQNRRN